MKTSLRVCLLEKTRADTCDEYRTSNMVLPVPKIFLKIIHAGIYHKRDAHFSNIQSDLRKRFETLETLYVLNDLF